MRTKRNGGQYGLRRNSRGHWCADFSVSGQRVQRSTGAADRAAAEEWCTAQAARIWRERKFGEAPGWTWREAVTAYAKAGAADGRRDLAGDADKARVLGPLLSAEARLTDLTSAGMQALLENQATARQWSGATHNRYRSFILGVVDHARGRGIGTPPDFRLARRREGEHRIRFLSREEAARLLAALPVHLARMAEFSLATGLRQANVTGLCWPEVSIERRQAWIWADSAKARRHIAVPLNDTAMRVLAAARDCQQHGDATRVFTYCGAAIAQPANGTWYAALRRAGIAGFRWHDLRHTWASWHVQAGTPLPVLQQLGAWADIRMVMRYAHLGADHTAQYAGNVEQAA